MPAQQHGLQNNILYGNHVNFDRNQGGMFNYFQNDLSVQPQLHATNHTMQSSGMWGNSCRKRTPPANLKSGGGVPLAGLPQPQVVIHTTTKGGPKKQAQPKKAGARGPKTKSRSGSPSSDESDLEIEAPDEPSPIPATRSNEPVAAAEFDTLQAVWSPRNKRPTADKVKSALVAFKDVIKVLRDAWKDQVQAMKLAENQGDNDKATKLKQEVALQRRIMDKIATTTMDMGHPMIVEKYDSPSLISPAFPICPHGFHGHRSRKPTETVSRVNSLLWIWIKSPLIRLEIREPLPPSGVITLNRVLLPVGGECRPKKMPKKCIRMIPDASSCRSHPRNACGIPIWAIFWSHPKTFAFPGIFVPRRRSLG